VDKKLVVAVTGATGSIYAVRLLQALAAKKIEVHLIVSNWGRETVRLETGLSLEDLQVLACYQYQENNLAAPVASGSFRHYGMVIIPCSMKTLAGIAHGYAANLIMRAADVSLKEKRKLILVPRETPLNTIHLENMLLLARAGAVIMPPVPAFYYHPQSVDEVIAHFTGRILDHLGIENEIIPRWGGLDEGCFDS